MKKFEVRSLWGILLIVLGVLFLFQTLGLIGEIAGLVWAFLFGVAGLVFLYVFLTDVNERWWAVIPGLALLGIGGLIFLGEVAPGLTDVLGAPFFLGAIALSFWVVYFLKRDSWWAIIPGGVLMTIAFMVLISTVLEGGILGGIFFLGLGFTFGLVYLLGTPREQVKWALIPAAVLAAMGVFVTIVTAEIFKYIWPLALIGGGAYLIVRMLLSRPAE